VDGADDGQSHRPTAPAWQDLRPARYFVEELISGEVVHTACGEHFETEKLFERHRRHGSMDISNLHELPADLLDSLSDGAIASSHPTSGLSWIPKPRAWRAAPALTLF
jgi:hypothetical protein